MSFTHFYDLHISKKVPDKVSRNLFGKLPLPKSNVSPGRVGRNRLKLLDQGRTQRTENSTATQILLINHIYQ